MTTIVRRRKLGITSIKGIIAASVNENLKYANNYEGIPMDNVYIRWGCTSTVPNKDAVVVNSADSIHRMSDKTGFRRLMQEEALCPYTWFTRGADTKPTPEKPLIVRSKTHAQGKGLWTVTSDHALMMACDAAGEGYYINEYIPKVAEYRVFVHQGYVAWVAQKTPGNPDAVAWNVAKGGRFDNVKWGDWNMDVVNCALKVFALTGAHFAGIDVMLDAEGVAWCVEANSAPSQTSPYRQSCVAKAFDYMTWSGCYDTDMREVRHPETWKDAIHPAVHKHRGGTVDE